MTHTHTHHRLLVTLAALTLTACTASPANPGSVTPSETPSPAPSGVAASPSPSPSPSASPTASPTPSPSAETGVATSWNGTIVRFDGKQASVSMRLDEVAQPNGTIALKGIWTLIGDFQETTAVNGYRQGDAWTLITTVSGMAIQFDAKLTDRRLNGSYRGLQGATAQGTLDITQQ